ncbi:MAG TPA: hypothetical protein VMV29_20380 [Ktedonobacterales bacterium]|nr:hypothetical protein [Ktedonobacterales bacterium]
MAPILIVVGDTQLRRLLQILLEHRYDIDEASGTDNAFDWLSTSAGPAVVLWFFIGESDLDETLLQRVERAGAAGRHVFLLLTPNRDALSIAIKLRLTRMQARVIGLPFDLDILLEQVARAQERATAGGFADHHQQSLA